MSRVGRLTVAAFTFAAAATLPLAFAGPAHADYDACAQFLASHGHDHPEDQQACQTGADGDFDGCVEILFEHGVEADLVFRACLLAAAPGEQSEAGAAAV